VKGLSGGLLCDRSAELERPVFFAAARHQSDNGAKERHDCDFLGHGDPHHCHGRTSLTSPPECPQHMIDAQCYFVSVPVRRGHGAFGSSTDGTTAQAVGRAQPGLNDQSPPRRPRAGWRIRSGMLSAAQRDCGRMPHERRTRFQFTDPSVPIFRAKAFLSPEVRLWPSELALDVATGPGTVARLAA